MDQPGQVMGVAGGPGQLPYGVPYQPNQVTGAPAPSNIGALQPAAGSHMAQHNLALYQQMHTPQQQQLQQTLQKFWHEQCQEIEKVTDFKNHSLPLARIKKIMKADEDVRMISAEAPVVFARACEMFILELTLRSWYHTEENKRRTLQKNDIAAAITTTDIFDFLVDIVPRDPDVKDEIPPRGTAVPVAGSAEAIPPSYYYTAPPHTSPQPGSAGGVMNVMDTKAYVQPSHPYMAPPMWPQMPPQRKQSSSDA
ncbi:hypothetical protein Dimus_021723 [Dionaea muscipula]